MCVTKKMYDLPVLKGISQSFLFLPGFEVRLLVVVVMCIYVVTFALHIHPPIKFVQTHMHLRYNVSTNIKHEEYKTTYVLF